MLHVTTLVVVKLVGHVHVLEVAGTGTPHEALWHTSSELVSNLVVRGHAVAEWAVRPHLLVLLLLLQLDWMVEGEARSGVTLLANKNVIPTATMHILVVYRLVRLILRLVYHLDCHLFASLIMDRIAGILICIAASTPLTIIMLMVALVSTGTVARLCILVLPRSLLFLSFGTG